MFDWYSTSASVLTPGANGDILFDSTGGYIYSVGTVNGMLTVVKMNNVGVNFYQA
jgi:hypothetical protein